MGVKQAVADRIRELCAQRCIKPNALAYLSGLDRSTLYSILGNKSKNPGIVAIKIVCDGLGVTLGEFFSTPEFDSLEQEIK